MQTIGLVTPPQICSCSNQEWVETQEVWCQRSDRTYMRQYNSILIDHNALGKNTLVLSV